MPMGGGRISFFVTGCQSLVKSMAFTFTFSLIDPGINPLATFVFAFVFRPMEAPCVFTYFSNFIRIRILHIWNISLGYSLSNVILTLAVLVQVTFHWVIQGVFSFRSPALLFGLREVITCVAICSAKLPLRLDFQVLVLLVDVSWQH